MVAPANPTVLAVQIALTHRNEWMSGSWERSSSNAPKTRMNCCSVEAAAGCDLDCNVVAYRCHLLEERDIPVAPRT